MFRNSTFTKIYEYENVWKCYFRLIFSDVSILTITALISWVQSSAASVPLRLTCVVLSRVILQMVRGVFEDTVASLLLRLHSSYILEYCSPVPLDRQMLAIAGLCPLNHRRSVAGLCVFKVHSNPKHCLHDELLQACQRIKLILLMSQLVHRSLWVPGISINEMLSASTGSYVQWFPSCCVLFWQVNLTCREGGGQ